MRNFPFFFSQGAKSFVRNGFMTMASTFILVICMLVVGSFWLIYQNIEHFLSNTDELYILKANIADTVTDDEIEEIEQKLSSLDNVTDCKYVSAEEAFERLKENSPEYAHMLDNKHNPMGRSFEISFSDPDKIDKLVYEVKNTPGIENTRERLDVYKTASTMKKTLSVICVWIIIALFVVSILVIMTTVRITIFARREEIFIMRYLGATGRFISAPLYVESMIIGIVSSALAFVLQYYLYSYIVKDRIRQYFAQSLVNFSDHALFIILAFLGVGFLAGILATAFSIKRYLKV